MTRDPRSDARATLRWYLHAGIDEAVGDAPIDRLAPPPPPPSGAAAEPPAPARAKPTVDTPRPTQTVTPARPRSAESAVRDAVSVAHHATTLEALRAALEAFDGCPLSRTATNLVFGRGSPDARMVFIGEAPGAEEDRQGLPFVGPSGKLLDRMLLSIGVDPSEVFISNTVFWRPPGNRNPTTAEIATCMPFVERIIELIAPDILVAVGGPAAGALLGRSDGIGRVRGRWFNYATAGLSRPVHATALFHPAYLLRSPGQKRLAWRDMLGIQKKLESL